jgi:hypothetical protein
MIKYTKPFFLFCLLALIVVETFAQGGTLNGVFAGVEVSLPTVMGQGMERTDRVIYFRPDGTFNHNLRRDDWLMAVSGSYTITGKKVNLQFNGGAKETMTLEDNGDLKAQGGLGSYGMLKMGTADRVPPGVYKFSSVSSTGGGASGQIFVGSGADVDLYFDGKGHFTRNAKSATMVSGGNTGGGVSNDNKSSGSYSIREGQLTLTFSDGKREKHSFFCRPGEKPLMAVINGSIFFMEEEKESEAMNTNNTAKTTTKKNEDAAPVTDARTLLYKANKVQGGSALDNIRSIRARATVSMYTVTSLVDVFQKRLRIEIRQSGTLQRIEQFDSNGAWQWDNGKKKALPADRLKEMKTAFESGVLALRRSVIDRMTNLELNRGANGKTAVIAELDGVKHAFLFNDRGELIGDGYAFTFTDYSNLKTVSGVLLPFSEKQKSGTNNLSVTYTEYEINPTFSESEWATQ